MAYDPYGAPAEQQPQGLGFKDIVTAPFEYYKFKYFQNPMTWSGTKGIALPFDFNRASYRIAGDAMANAYKDKGFFAAVKAPFSKWKDMKAVGGRAFGYDNYISRLTQAQQEVSRVVGMDVKPQRILAERERLLKRMESLRKGQMDLMWQQREMGTSMKYKSFSDMYMPDPSQPSFKARARLARKLQKREEYLKTWTAKTEGRLTEINKFFNTRSVRTSKLVKGAESKVTALVRKRWAMRGLKWGVRGMKAVSAVGFLAFAADAAGMVFEPIGASLVQQANSLAERYEQRFMPELGGRLNMAYMSTGAATERQRAIQGISKAYINGRSAYGSEAAYMHS